MREVHSIIREGERRLQLMTFYLFFIFYFFIGKRENIIKVPKRRHGRVHKKYKINAQNRREEQKQKTSPYFKCNQSTKSIIDIVWSSIYTLAHFTKVYIKPNLIVWLDYSTSLKTLVTFPPNSPQQAQRNGPPYFLPHKRVMLTHRFLLIEECMTQTTPKRE